MEKLNDPGHFTCSLHNWYTMGLLDRRTTALALSCMNKIRSVVVVLCGSQFPSVRLMKSLMDCTILFPQE